MIAIVPILIALVGILLWAMPRLGKPSEAGKWLFIIGVGIATWMYRDVVVHLFGR